MLSLALRCHAKTYRFRLALLFLILQSYSVSDFAATTCPFYSFRRRLLQRRRAAIFTHDLPPHHRHSHRHSHRHFRYHGCNGVDVPRHDSPVRVGDAAGAPNLVLGSRNARGTMEAGLRRNDGQISQVKTEERLRQGLII